MSLADLKKLLVKRSHLERKFGGIESFVNQFDSSKNNVNEVQVRLAEMPKIREEYESVIFSIIEIEEESDGEVDPSLNDKGKDELSALEKFDEKWFKIMSDLQSHFQSFSLVNNANAASTGSVSSPNPSQFNVRLPRINLPQFSGEYTEWLPFYNAFDSLIHQNHALDNCQKFHYLKSCLKDEAARPVESLSVTADNYQSAWSILQKRYKNDRLIVQSHVQAIMNTPEISKPSAEALRKLLNDISSNLAALKVMKIAVDSWDAFLVPLILARVDYQSRKELEQTLDSNIPKLSDVLEFLEKRCITLQSVQSSAKISRSDPSSTKREYVKRSSYVVTSKISCRYCNKRHFVNQCEEFLRLDVNERINRIKRRNLCLNCLRGNHVTSMCKARGCNICQSRNHHSLLHSNVNNSEIITSPEGETISEIKINATVNHHRPHNEPQVILSTALVLVKDQFGKYYECRALLDVGSQINLMSTAICRRLGLKTRDSAISISGINYTCTKVSKSVETTVKSLDCRFEKSTVFCVTERVTSNLPINTFETRNLFIGKHLNLADPEFNVSRPIDLLIGAELFWELLGNQRIKLADPSLYLTQTKLGWVIGGSIDAKSNLSKFRVSNLAVKESNTEVQSLIEKFWVQEELPENTKGWSKEEIECEKQFQDTYYRDKTDGKFVIKLPFKGGNLELGDSNRTALKRFLSLEKKFNKDEKFRLHYTNAIQELIDAKFIEEVPVGEVNRRDVYYLPHSGVLKLNRQTTKVRIVFDGSSKSSNGLSLNDILMTGPNLQTELFDLLIRFRSHQVAFSCDMEKMFLQIKIHPNDVDYQRFFWRSSETDSLRVYRLLRLVFGLTNSPYTAMRCVKQLAVDAFDKFPIASRVIQNDIYMDDVLSGAADIHDAILLRDQIIETLSGGGFKLTKWASNDSNILPDSLDYGVQNMVEIDKGNTSKVLGLWWNFKEDVLRFKVSILKCNSITKRSILSSIARLFDPIGIISPVTVKAKIIMKQLWALKLDWDDVVPVEIQKVWEKFLIELEDLNTFVIPRKVLPIPNGIHDLVVFCDASLQAYGAVVYIRTSIGKGSYETHMVCSKSKVSPVKVITLPRLELCAAVLGSRLLNKVLKALNVEIRRKYYFSDSIIVLHYISSNANTWQVFVGNRISQIQSLSEVEDWYHVDTKQNPADFVSRGAFPKQIADSKMFWHGPEFLANEQSLWPESRFQRTMNIDELPEKRKVVLVNTTEKKFDLLSKYSAFSKLQKVVCFILRFIHNVRNKNNRQVGNLTSEQLKEAKTIILKLTQDVTFFDEINSLKKDNRVSKSSRLFKLDPFLDENGLIRVGGRLRKAAIRFDAKYPILLPAKHHVTILLIRLEHVNLLHAGFTQTLSSIRRKYWPLGARTLVRKLIRSCKICFRSEPRLMQQKMGDLPKVRTEPVRPFLHVGLDYFGPIYLKTTRRSKIKVKAWVALFVCMASKAVHLEVVSDMTAECFINALKRLFARRGRVLEIYCDNAKTFVGAKSEIEEIIKTLSHSQLDAFLSVEGIKWNFIPPRSPNFGGLWERLVRSAKQHFKRIVLNSCLNYEEAVTLLTQIESIINSRPLTPLSQDPSDFHCLTPAHFLIGEPLVDVPEVDLTTIQTNRLNRWQLIQTMKQHFWKRWSKEVLHNFQIRTKWGGSPSFLQVGDLVLIAEDNLPSLKWKMGRIEEVFPGSDGIVRVASVRTSQGVYRRSIRKLAVLPKEECVL